MSNEMTNIWSTPCAADLFQIERIISGYNGISPSNPADLSAAGENLPCFSVIMATYNRAYCICDAIDSLLKQSYENFELIVVDDGSTDETRELISEKYEEQLRSHRIRYFAQEKRGVCATRNFGLLQARYDWIAYLDTDNILHPEFLKTYAEAIVANPSFSIFNARLIKLKEKAILGNAFDKDKMLYRNTIDLGCFVHHASVARDLGAFDENMPRLSDWDLAYRYCSVYPSCFIDKIVLIYNDSDDADRITNTAALFRPSYNYFIRKHGSFPSVTVIILSYNHEKYIRTAIESALAQIGPFAMDILISDDASTDSTRDIIREYARKYPHLIKDISNSVNAGISENYRHCFRHVTGKYVAVLEGDDYWIKDRKLYSQMQFLEQNEDCSMVFCGLNLLKENGFQEHALRRDLPSKLTGSDLLSRGVSLIANWSCCMFRTELIKELPEVLFENRLSEIAVSFFMEKHGKIGYLKDVMSVYRIHEAGAWSGADKKSRLLQQKASRLAAMSVCDPNWHGAFQAEIDRIGQEFDKEVSAEQKRLQAEIRIIESSDYFDAQWYSRQNHLGPDDNPAEHFILNSNLLANPSERFDSKSYYSINYDVARNGKNALLHYEKYGKKEGRILSFEALTEKHFANDPVLLKDYYNDDVYISVIVTGCDHEDLVSECMDSLLKQSYRNFEIIIVTGAAAGAGCEVIKKYMSETTDIPVSLYTHTGHTDNGPAKEIELGVRKASGMYVAFCKAHDTWTPDHLEKVVDLLKKCRFHPRIICNDADIFGDPDLAAHSAAIRSESRRRLSKVINRISPEEWRRRNYILTMSCACVRKDVLGACDFNVVGIPAAIDWWLWRQICFRHPLFYLEDKLTGWRMFSPETTRRPEGQEEARMHFRDFIKAGDMLLKIGPPAEKPADKTDAAEILAAENDDLKAKVEELSFSISEIRKSFSFKAGRFLSFLPRLARHLIAKTPM